MIISLSTNIIREFRTKKAAEKYAKRIIGGADVKASLLSHFGFILKPGSKIYQVIQD